MYLVGTTQAVGLKQRSKYLRKMMGGFFLSVVRVKAKRPEEEMEAGLCCRGKATQVSLFPLDVNTTQVQPRPSMADQFQRLIF